MHPLLKLIADNPELTKELRAFLEKQFESDAISSGMTDEQIGQVTRARLLGMQKLDQAFLQISRMKTVKEPEERSHPGR